MKKNIFIIILSFGILASLNNELKGIGINHKVGCSLLLFSGLGLTTLGFMGRKSCSQISYDEEDKVCMTYWAGLATGAGIILSSIALLDLYFGKNIQRIAYKK